MKDGHTCCVPKGKMDSYKFTAGRRHGGSMRTHSFRLFPSVLPLWSDNFSLSKPAITYDSSPKENFSFKEEEEEENGTLKIEVKLMQINRKEPSAAFLHWTSGDTAGFSVPWTQGFAVRH